MSSLQVKFQQARSFQQQGRFSNAQAICQKILSARPNQLDTLILSGVLAGQTRDFVRAVRFFDHAIQVAPKNSVIYCNRGLALRELKRFEEALADYETAIALKSDYALAYFNRGSLLKIGNDRHRSIALAEIVQRLPGDFQYFCLQKEIGGTDREASLLIQQ